MATTHLRPPVFKTTPSYLLGAVIIAIAYFVSAKLGLSLAETTKQVTTVWPPTGIALVALSVFGYRYWPAILVGAFVANISTQETATVAAIISVGNTLEALTGAYLLRRYAGFKGELNNVKSVLGLVVLAAILSTLLSATVGTTTLGFGHLITWDNYSSVGLRWWVGDMMGDLILAPFLFIVLNRRLWRAIASRSFELLLVLSLLTVTSLFIFITTSPGAIRFPLPYLVFPPIIWAAMRFREVGAITGAFIISSIATVSTIHNRGPFSQGESIEQNLIFLYVFIGIVAVTSMLLGAVVAERDENEQALLDHTKVLAKARSRAIRSIAESQKSERQKDQLVSMASHELKTPLTSTKIFTEILLNHLKQTPGSKQATDYAARVSQGLDRLVKLTSDLIDVNKSKTGKFKLDKELVDIDELIETTVADIQLTTKGRRLRLKGRVGRAIKIDGVRIRQVLVNLLTNAIRYSSPGSEIIIHTKADRQGMTVRVQDFGDGIPKSEQVKIFEPYYQGTSKKRRGQLGLGLHIARQIIDLHGGKIWVESQPKKGSTFAFSLPLPVRLKK